MQSVTRWAASITGGYTSSVRLPETAHTARPWRIHEIAPDFKVEDVWALPTPGGPDDFPRLVKGITSFDPAASSPVVRALFAVRFKLGALLGWDRPEGGLGTRVSALRNRLPADLRALGSAPESGGLPFSPLYSTKDEWAAEIANETVHGVIHLGWVEEDGGRYRGQMAILVKPNGRLGKAYMTAITPFRHLIVYPTMLRTIERRW